MKRGDDDKDDEEVEIEYDDMSFLNADEFAEFYRCISKGDRLTIQKQKPVIKLTKDNIDVNDALVSPTDLLRVAVFNDLYRKDIGWLEFWVYVCSDGEKPLDEEYFLEEKCNLSFIIIHHIISYYIVSRYRKESDGQIQ